MQSNNLYRRRNKSYKCLDLDTIRHLGYKRQINWKLPPRLKGKIFMSGFIEPNTPYSNIQVLFNRFAFNKKFCGGTYQRFLIAKDFPLKRGIKWVIQLITREYFDDEDFDNKNILYIYQTKSSKEIKTKK